MNEEAADVIKKLFSVTAMDKKTALLNQMEKQFHQQQMRKIANAAKQPVTLELSKI